jgi:hypothetical protein
MGMVTIELKVVPAAGKFPEILSCLVSGQVFKVLLLRLAEPQPEL